MTDFIQRNCPSCNQVNHSDGAIYSTPSAESITFQDIKSYWSGFFKEKIFFSYHRCDCGLLYCPTFLTDEQLAHLYANMSDNTAGVSLTPLLKTQRGYFNRLKRYINTQGSYLELGPDIGLFTEHIVKNYSFDSYWLFEPNREIWSVLKQKMQAQRYHLLPELNNLESIPDSSLSTVVMIHVLDHLLNPLHVLQQIKQKAKPGAVVLFVTHDEKSLLAQLTKKKWPAYCLQHPQLFNPNSIASLVQQAGMNVLECQKAYNYFPITYLLKHLLWTLNINIKLPEWASLSTRLKLGNIVTIAET